jgi:hypothetical protein
MRNPNLWRFIVCLLATLWVNEHVAAPNLYLEGPARTAVLILTGAVVLLLSLDAIGGWVDTKLGPVTAKEGGDDARE